jgi:hypothetical protein
MRLCSVFGLGFGFALGCFRRVEPTVLLVRGTILDQTSHHKVAIEKQRFAARFCQDPQQKRVNRPKKLLQKRTFFGPGRFAGLGLGAA